MFKPVYIEFARDFVGQHPEVEFHAVSCLVFGEVCRQQQLRGYPSVFAYPAGSDKGVYLQRAGAGKAFDPDVVAKALELDGATTTAEARSLNGPADEPENDENDEPSDEDKTTDEEGQDAAVSNAREANEDDSESSADNRDDSVVSAAYAKRKSITKLPPVFKPYAGDRQPLGETGKALGLLDNIDLATPREDNAGAIRAAQRVKNMERWREAMESSKKAHGIDRASLHQSARQRTMRSRFSRGKPLARLDRQVGPGDTATMKAHKPGTVEFADQRKEMIGRINAALDKGHFRNRTPKLTESDQVRIKDLPYKIEPKKPGFVRTQAEKLPVVKKMFKMSPQEELIVDASLALFQSVKNAVSMRSSALNEKQKSALKNWLELMSVSLPQEWGLHTFIDVMRSNLKSITTEDNSFRNFGQLMRKTKIPRTKWSPSCIDEGFNCGMWKLLHIMSIGVAEHRGGLNLVEAKLVDLETRIFSPADAAEVVRDYIESFFACTSCREEFVKNYESCEYRRCDRLTKNAVSATGDDWKQVALWLWEAHNAVNVRVLKEKAIAKKKMMQLRKSAFADSETDITIAQEIEAIFPDIETCFVCVQEDGTWDENSVFGLLEKTYWESADSKERLIIYDKSGGQDATGGGLIWMMLLVAVSLVYTLRRHIPRQSGLNKLSLASIPSVKGVATKLGDTLGGKKHTV